MKFYNIDITFQGKRKEQGSAKSDKSIFCQVVFQFWSSQLIQETSQYREISKKEENHQDDAAVGWLKFSQMKVTRKIDFISFCVFPTCFIIYNLVYWYWDNNSCLLISPDLQSNKSESRPEGEINDQSRPESLAGCKKLVYKLSISDQALWRLITIAHQLMSAWGGEYCTQNTPSLLRYLHFKRSINTKPVITENARQFSKKHLCASLCSAA